MKKLFQFWRRIERWLQVQARTIRNKGTEVDMKPMLVMLFMVIFVPGMGE